MMNNMDVPSECTFWPYASKNSKSSLLLSNTTELAKTCNDFEPPNPSPNTIEERIYSFGANGPGVAYFSSQPPVQPLRLMLIGQLPDKLRSDIRVQFLLRNFREIDRRSDSGFDSVLREADWSPNRTSSSLRHHDEKDENDTEASSTDETVKNHDREHNINDISKPSRPKCSRHQPKQMVQLILRQLIENLPLTLQSSGFSSSDQTVKVSPRLHRSLTSLTRCRLENTSREQSCNVAVQAQLNEVNSGSAIHCNNGLQSDAEEWVGGVRALRDSHVRLVLRQLRHIERLNRTLDRATRSRVGTAAHAKIRS